MTAVTHRLHINREILCPEVCPGCKKAFAFVDGTLCIYTYKHMYLYDI